MSKVAFTTLLKREDSALSPHFGTAKWIMIYDCDTAQIAFEQNTALNGRGVADVVARHGCRDAVFTRIGGGGLRQLSRASIRGWIGPSGVPVPELIERWRPGELTAAQAGETTFQKSSTAGAARPILNGASGKRRSVK